MPATGAWQGSINRPDAIYTVAAGDSLSKIAEKFYRDPMQYTRIAQANGLSADKVLQVGTRLKIPNGGTLDPPKTAVPTSAPVQPGAPVNQVAAKVTPGFTALSLSDWRVWVGGGLLLAAAYLLLRRRR